MGRVAHFEIQVGDLERAKTFYAAVFGWSFEDFTEVTGTPYWGITTGPSDEPGINGGLLERDAPTPGADHGANAYVCTIVVDDYDSTEARILDAGGQTTVPKTALPGMAWQGYYRDLDSNTFGIHQSDPDAR